MQQYICQILTALLLFGCHTPSKYNIMEYGATPDGKTNNAPAIQKAIDNVSANGGRILTIPAGYFVSGSIQLKSGVELYFEKGAVLAGSTSRLDYGNNDAKPLIFADNAQNISITGQGIIDGRGGEVIADLYCLLRNGILKDTMFNIKRPSESVRPRLIVFKRCNQVKISGIQLKNSAGWVLTLEHSQLIDIDSIKIESTTYWNNDGIDVVNSKDVFIRNCHINSADDGICLKSEGEIPGICEDVLIENCTVRSSASAFKIGTGSRGGFKNIKVNGLAVYDTYRSAIAIECVDGGTLDSVEVKNVTAKNTGNAILVRLGHRNKDSVVGCLKNVYIRNINVEVPGGKPDVGYPVEGPRQKYPHNVFPASITGIPGHPAQNIMLENIHIIYKGDATKETSFFDWKKLAEVPENEAGYPEFSMFGELPAWGLYVRHVQGLTLNGVSLNKDGSDYRPSCIFDDVEQLYLNNFTIAGTNTLPAMVFYKVSNVNLDSLNLPAEPKQAIKKWP